MDSKRTKPKITAIGMTDPGSRNYNEDGFLTITGTWQHIFAVCDGMGGHAAGEVASSLAVETIKEHFLQDRNAELGAGQFLNQAISGANYTIYEDGRANTERAGMGSTCVVALVRGARLSVGHVGDSRAYLVRSGGIRQLTRDHSFVEEMVKAGMITPHEAHTNPQRNVILQSLGRGDGVNVDVSEDAVALRAGDYVVLCSDGLTAVVADQEIAETIERLSEPRLVVEELIELTNRRGGPDNVTVICARYDGEQIEGPTIAVICDDSNSADLYRLVLQRAGFSIELYSSMNATLDLQVAQQPRLVIIEHADGQQALDLCAQLRQEGSLKKAPFLLVSNAVDPKQARAVSAQVLASSKLLTDLVPAVQEAIEAAMPKVYALDLLGNLDPDLDDALRAEGCSPFRATSLKALLDRARVVPPRLVLIHADDDVEIPCATIREQLLSCPLVLTAEGAVSNAREAYAVGADYYLPRTRDVVALAKMLLHK